MFDFWVNKSQRVLSVIFTQYLLLQVVPKWPSSVVFPDLKKVTNVRYKVAFQKSVCRPYGRISFLVVRKQTFKGV